MGRFADIVLPLAQPCYTFSLEETPDAAVGDAVAVQFGRNTIYTGIVWRIHDTPPSKGKVKPVLALLYDRPLLNSRQIKLWEWMSEYYMCTLGEIMRVALPALIKPKAGCESEFEPYEPPQERVVTLLNGDWESANFRSEKRRFAMEKLAALGGEAPLHALGIDLASVRALEKGGLVSTSLRVRRTVCSQGEMNLPELSQSQSVAFSQIEAGYDNRDVVLLHGVTSSGKTEIYTQFAAKALQSGKDVLYLVPEISLTSQLVERLKHIFGERVTPYHSRLTPVRRTRIYTDMVHSQGGNLIIGARSAIFLPYHNLGLVIVDEEQDSSYKQTEPNPRYNGRDTAVMLAHIHGCKCLMGSATPSLESYANTMMGKYAYVSLSERYGGSQKPVIRVSDTIRAVKRGERKTHFNHDLLDAIRLRLENNEQVLLFQNRRGYSPYVECPECGWTARCPHCNVSLTMHSSRMECHYCGYSAPVPHSCPSCHMTPLRPMGFGTEKVEVEIASIFPQARVLRLDHDTASSAGAYSKIIESFSRHEADILVGTQIITKGLDFDGVTLIGILNADNLLNAPDFRASERGWQTIMQVAGRAGRRERQGEVFVQTSDPKHPVFSWLDDSMYETMAASLLRERKAFQYPPYVKMVKVIMRSADRNLLFEQASILASRLRNIFASRVFGPVSPLVDRIRDQFIVEVSLKIELTASFSRAKKILTAEIAQLKADPKTRNMTILCDVDYFN